MQTILVNITLDFCHTSNECCMSHPGTILSQTIIKKCMRLHLAANDRVQNANGLQLDINKDHELPLLNFSWISTATNNFSFANRLGEGGFGPVFKVYLIL